MKIGLFIPSFFKYDAMGNDVYNMYKILTEMGYNVVIYANDFCNDKSINVQHVNNANRFLNSSKNLIIYHHGVYTDFFEKIANSKPIKIFRYHNITYPELFEGYDEFAVDICKKGREQLVNNIYKFDLFLSCSKFNNQELINVFGIDENKSKILAPFNNIDEWENINSEPIKDFDKNKINILNIGRLSPNKNHQLLIKAFADYNKNYNNNSILHIVGKIGPEKYYKEIIRLIDILNIKNNVYIYANGISDKKIKYLYKNSDLFVMTSKHEGFCVPIVESMFFGLPIVSSSATALKDTVGKYGILLDELDYINFSVAIKYAIAFKNSLSNLSKKGYNRFQYEDMKKNFVKYIIFLINKYKL